MHEAIVHAGRGTELVALPEPAWWAELERHLPAVRRRHEALPALHREVRRAAVRLLVATGRPVPATALAREVGAAVGEVEAALSDLERGLFFLVRDGRGEVSWAFPVTADVTPHALAFASGERLYGA